LTRVLEQVNAIAALLVREFSLKGLNGMDFIVDRENEVHLLEVNPRYSASMELIEQSLGANLFLLHLAAVGGQLPASVPALQEGETLFYGKAIIYAEADIVMPDTRNWPGKGVRDIPFPGEAISGGQPVCTVFAVGNSREECFRKLRQQARSLKKLISQG
jgi:predicted ATP-grasp superfamily ATP-dependent carboligase